MKLTEKEKKAMLELAKKRKRSKKSEWWVRHFSGVPQGWKETDEDEK